MLHTLAIVCIAVAGACYCLAAGMRWKRIIAESAGLSPLWLLWVGLAAHSASLALTLVDGSDRDFTYLALGLWAAVASIFFMRRFLAVPSKWLLVLPIGGMAILIAMASAAGGGTDRAHETTHPVGWIVALHIIFMSLHLGATLVAAAAGGLYLVAVRQLKRASARAFKLPNLPLLEGLIERGLVIATALLLGGLATGAALHFYLMDPVILLSLVDMALLILALALRATNGIGRRGLAAAAILCLIVTACADISLLVRPHG